MIKGKKYFLHARIAYGFAGNNHIKIIFRGIVKLAGENFIKAEGIYRHNIFFISPAFIGYYYEELVK